MKTEEVEQRIIPGRKIFTFSQDEVKEIMLKAANEAALTKEDMHHRVIVSVNDGNEFHGEWIFVLSVEEVVCKPQDKEEYCPECRVGHHDACSMTPGCPCCDDTFQQLAE